MKNNIKMFKTLHAGGEIHKWEENFRKASHFAKSYSDIPTIRTLLFEEQIIFFMMEMINYTFELIASTEPSNASKLL